jgi:hypothetical protein
MRPTGARSAVLGLACLTATMAFALATATSAFAIALPFHSNMSGAQQAATGIPGDPDGSGTASFSMDTISHNVCFTVSWSNVTPPVGFGHIHEGAAGQVENPGFTIPLFMTTSTAGVSSPQSGCTLTIPGQIEAINLLPSFFNVVIHNLEHPVGAIRGQIVRG